MKKIYAYILLSVFGLISISSGAAAQDDMPLFLTEGSLMSSIAAEEGSGSINDPADNPNGFKRDCISTSRSKINKIKVRQTTIITFNPLRNLIGTYIDTASISIPIKRDVIESRDSYVQLYGIIRNIN